MGYVLSEKDTKDFIGALSQAYDLYGPVRYTGQGEYYGTDSIRYGRVQAFDDLVLNEKSQFSWKEILLPINQTLFYFREDDMVEAQAEREKPALVFARSCDIHAVKRLDAIYLENGPEDYYYRRLRDKVHFILIGCPQSFENCFCIDMGTSQTDNYLFSFDLRDTHVHMDVKDQALLADFRQESWEEEAVTPDFVREADKHVRLSDDIAPVVITKADIWNDYNSRCISCGRCNFSCPTCTCTSMQDLFYRDNPKAGERRRVHASCMVDGFSLVAGGGDYRRLAGERMRFRVLHKIYDFRARFGYDMCVGCGRCDDVCPEYISFSHAVNRVADVMDSHRKEAL